MAATSLHLLAKQALTEGSENLTFNISTVETKAFPRTKNVAFRATTDQGTVVTFWASNMDSVVESMDDDGNFRVIPGTRRADDGSLWDDSQRKGIWD
jgi:hypothetical protein